MLHDPKAKSLAREFAAQWLDFHHFDAHTKVDENKFPEFTSEIRRAFCFAPDGNGKVAEMS
jgi:hypothetical protein